MDDVEKAGRLEAAAVLLSAQAQFTWGGGGGGGGGELEVILAVMD